MLADKKVDLVIEGRIGPNMVTTLQQKNIKFKEETGKIKKLLIKFSSNKK